MSKNHTSIYVWPLITYLLLHFYKVYLLGGYHVQLYFNIVTDILLIILIGVISIQRTGRWLQWMQSLFAILIITYELIDTCVYLAIQNRFTLNNLIGNIEYINVFPYFFSMKMALLVLTVVCLPLLLRKRTFTLPYAPTATSIMGIELLIVFTIAYFIMNGNSTVYSGGLNLSTNSYTATSVTSDTLVRVNTSFSSVLQRIQNYFDGKNWNSIPDNQAEKPNIVIVVSESLSMVDSKYAGGLFDRLPMLDKVQQEGLVFTHTVSNGKITPHGLAAFILGIQTTKTGGYAGMVDQFTPEKFQGNNIVSYAKKAGYNTIMISPGQPFSFYQMGDWFKRVGFDTIYSIDSEIFSTAPRFTWHAPSDQAMFDAALNMLPGLKKPYFLVIETVSLHQPYILPDIKYRLGDNDLLNLINYVDGTSYSFYQGLKKQDFFANGLFFIFGDHRRFERLETAEVEDGGYSVWHERIVCSIVGKGIPPHSVYNGAFSLVDMNSLLHYVVNGQPVNENTLVQASLSQQLGSEIPYSISLVDDDHGTYLIRSEKFQPLYISIFGNLPFDQIPNDTYLNAVIYLIGNNQQMMGKISRGSSTKGGAF